MLQILTLVFIPQLSEKDAFDLLKHLMFQRQMRLNYLPDMKQFQLQLYQLSRLIKDNIPELYELFDKNDVATTLYASSWMLTVFSSCFELGFVTKVYGEFNFLFFIMKPETITKTTPYRLVAVCVQRSDIPCDFIFITSS